MTDLALRPRSSTEIIDLAVRLLRRRFGAFFTIALVGLVPGLLVQVVLLLTAGADPLVAGARVTYSSPVNFVFAAFMVGSLTAYADDVLRTGEGDVRAALTRGGTRLPVVLGVTLLSSLATIVGFVLFVFPGVYAALRLTTAVPSAVLEGDGVLDSLRHAWSRGEGYVGHTFATLLLMGLVYLVFFVVVGMVGAVAVVAGAAGGAGHRGVVIAVLLQAATTVAMAAVYPLFTNTVLLLTYDLRVRREGYDVEAMADALGAAR